MSEHEAYRPQTESTAEQPQNRPTPEAGAAGTRPENEVAANPRILALMQERDAAERRLQEAILDLETREQSPAFQKAKELFDDGNRLVIKVLEDGGIIRFLLSEQNNSSQTLKSYNYSGVDWDENKLVTYDEKESLPGDLGQQTISTDMLHYLLDLTQENMTS